MIKVQNTDYSKYNDSQSVVIERTQLGVSYFLTSLLLALNNIDRLSSSLITPLQLLHLTIDQS